MTNTINITNNSVQNQKFVIFQKSTGPGMQLPLAWKVFEVAQGSRKSFSWQLNYSFYWAITKRLVPGTLFKSPHKPIPASIPDANQIALEPHIGVYKFGVPQANPRNGFTFVVENQIPQNHLSVAYGVDGLPMMAAQADPDTVIFMEPPSSTYYLATGNYTEGEALDPYTLLARSAQLFFTSGTQAFNVVLFADGRMSVSPAG